jgi:hypothetical protein
MNLRLWKTDDFKRDSTSQRLMRWTCMPGKRVQLDDETWMALDLLARDRMMDFQELADEAFRDLLKKHNRPADLRAALRQSAGVSPEVPELPSKRKREKPPKV